MNKITISIIQQIEILKGLMDQAKKAAKKTMEGTLVIGCKGSVTEWYIIRKNMKRIYLPKKEETVARHLAQHSYAVSFLRKAEAIRGELEQLLRLHAERTASFLFHALSEPYARLSEPRKKLVEPYVYPDEEFIGQWERVTYDRKRFDPDSAEIFSEKGERVRSKSEKMLADKLFLMGIPYRYEFPQRIPGMGTLNPDFTLLDARERTIVILEHFGLMDDPDYCRNALRKIDQYEKAGYFLGKQLLCTFESNQHMLDMKHFELMIRERFQVVN